MMELVLATDLKRHFDILVEFNEKVFKKISSAKKLIFYANIFTAQVNTRGLDWKAESDRLLIMQM